MPKIILILFSYTNRKSYTYDQSGEAERTILNTSVVTTSYEQGGLFYTGNHIDDTYGKKSSNGKTFYWYAGDGNSYFCFNNSGYTYVFMGYTYQ